MMGDITYDELGVAEHHSLGFHGSKETGRDYPDQGNELQWFVPWDQR
jgi:hypothetical protein